MGLYVEAPTHYHKHRSSESVFLAGGITGCPDWQKTIRGVLREVDVDVLNPRRANFDVDDSHASHAQVEWEFDMLAQADAILFWFPKETLCPIVLYELGFQLGRRRYSQDAWTPHLFIGIEPGYARAFDVRKQAELAGYEEETYTSLVTLGLAVKAHFTGKK